MDNRAIEIVRDNILKHLDKSDDTPEFEVYTVWKSRHYRTGNILYLPLSMMECIMN